MTTARARAKDLFAFVGRPTVKAVCLLWSFGLTHLLLELAFAYLLQQFLSALGLVSVERMNGPRLAHGRGLSQIVLLIFVVAAARAAVAFAQGVVGGRAMESFSHRMRRLLVADCLDASTVNTPETLTFFNQRIYTASTAIQSVQALAMQGVLTLGLLSALFLMGPLPTVLTLLVVAAASWPVRALNRSLKRNATVHAETLNKIMVHLNNVFRNFLLIRLFNLQTSEKVRIEGHLKTYSECIKHYYWVDGLTGAVVPLVAVVTVLWIALMQDGPAAVERGLAVPYLYLSFRFAQSLAPLANNLSRLNFAAPEFWSTFRWWRNLKGRPAKTSDSDAPGREETTPVRNAVGWRLKGVSFGYPGQPRVFSDFDLDVRPGSLVLVRGPSGVGKSTLVRLVVGEALPEGGSVEVELDGELFPVGSAAARLREHIGYSSTEPFLFEGTIYENIVYGLKAPPDEGFLLESAARAECQFIFELPGKFNHPLDELGQGLSTGQKQRLSLLRALLRRPRALILDEALSNVDIRTEQRILSNLLGLKSGCTILLISHRDQAGVPADAMLDLNEQLGTFQSAVRQ